MANTWKTTVHDIVQVDQSTFDFPHNTQWFQNYQGVQEPDKVTPVTYSPESNPAFDRQNSPGGFPNRFCRKPESEWFSNEGEVNNALIEMLKNKAAAIDNMTIDIVAITRQYALYVGGRLAVRTLTRAKALQICQMKFPQAFATGAYEIKEEDYKVSKQADLSNAYWIAPDGTEFQVRGSNFGNSYGRHDTHDGWIKDNLEMLKNDYNINPRKDLWGLHLDTRDLIDNGWIRIGDSHGKDWGVSVKDLNNIPSSVDNLLAQFAPDGAKIEIDDSHNQYEVIEWPVKSIQQAVNKAKRMAKQAAIDFDQEYPIANGSVDGRTILDGVPNQSSIGASLTDYDILPGIREVSFSSFTQMPNLSYYSADEERRTKQLAEQIQQSNEITPLIVVIDNQGPYILEGGHRFDALREIGANSFPAMVVLDNESLKQNTVAKQASIEEIDGVPVFVNPSQQELESFSKKLHSGRMFRGLLDPHTGDLFVWDAYEAIHISMIQKLGLDIKYSDDSTFALYFPPSSISSVLGEQQEFKRRLGKRKKTAGDQSASVPDYLINEWKTDQLHDDISEEPYVNHDQRDYSWGFHDSPENTGYNIGWPKDNSRAVVRLDTLENPAYRLDPFGVGEYNVTYYTAMPASDGIEQMDEE